jgi:hypothetical protein
MGYLRRIGLIQAVPSEALTEAGSVSIPPI